MCYIVVTVATQMRLLQCKSSLQTYARNQPVRRAQQTLATGERAHTDGNNRRQSQPSRLPQQSSRSDKSNHHLETRQRSRSPTQSFAFRTDRHSDQPRRNEEHGRTKRRRPSLRRAEHQHGQSRDQTRSNEPSEQSRRSSTTTKGVEVVNEPSSGKRKCTTADDRNDTEHPGTKKQRLNHPMQERPECPVPRTSVATKTPAPRSTATTTTTTTPVAKGQHYSERETLPQLPTPPSSNGSPEHESSSKQTPAAQFMSATTFTPTPAEKRRGDQTAPRPAGAELTRSRKRQRDDDAELCEEPKRLRQLKASEPNQQRQQPPVGPLPTPKQTRPEPKALARAVRPESSFAPVTPNHTCELKHLDYLHDSVPILYSSMVAHSSDSHLLNNPSGTLVVNALAIVGPSVDPQANRGWPSTIEVPGRTASATNPVKVVKDVDLYLHQNSSKLCVATDRGLITVTAYLDLIGVPKWQPVRFEGSIPSWARAAFRNPEKRRIVWQEKHNAGKSEIVPYDAAIGPHQLTLTLKAHVDVLEERAHIEVWEEQTKPKEEAKPVDPLLRKIIDSKKEKQERQPGPGEIKILTAEPGQLPLRAGSVVLVYAVDDEDNWAYGRLSGTNIMGRLQMAFTCPLDWSQDRFAAPDNSLNEPRHEPKNERNWRGPFHWLREAGYAYGPTWEQTVEAGAARARDEKARLLAARKSRVSTEASPTPEVTEASPKHDASQQPSSDKQSSEPAVIAHEATVPSTAADGEVEEATPMVFSPHMDRDVGSTAAETSQAKDPVEDTSKIEVESNVHLEPDHDEGVGISKESSQDQRQEVVAVSIVDSESREVEYKEGMSRTDTNLANVSTEQEHRKICADVANVGVDREAEGETTETETKATTEASKTSDHENPFAKPRLDLWARNDDIEYDWGDSDEEY